MAADEKRDFTQRGVFGGTHIATQGGPSSQQGQILFHTADPVTGTVGTFAGSGTFTIKEESEPLGQQIETTDPDPYPATYADWHGMGKDPEWQCLKWEEFRSGDFFSMPVHCQKKVVQGGKFSIRQHSAPTNVTKHADSPIRDLSPMDSQADLAMSYALAASSKPDKKGDDDDDDDEGIGCDLADPDNGTRINNSKIRIQNARTSGMALKPRDQT